MADILLRERAAVLARTLDVVGRVIDVLERSRLQADAPPGASGSMASTLAAMGDKVGDLRESANSAQFASGTKPAFDLAVAGVEAYLEELGRLLHAPPATLRVTVRLEQLVGSLTDGVDERRGELNELVNALDAPDGLPDEVARTQAWQRCLQIESDCERLFADYLDLVRGVALRDSGLDDGLCRIADALLLELGPFGSTTWKSLTVPASRERYDGPVATFVRIGFPEWSVWTLPLAAVEFASFLIVQHQRFINLHGQATKTLQKLIADNNVGVPAEVLALLADRRDLPDDPKVSDPLVRAALDRLTGILVVEALATALIGPAYGWSAVLMRVRPQPGYDLVERLRRDAVLGTVQQLEVEGHSAARKDLLKSEWDVLLASIRVTPFDQLHQAFAELVSLVIEGVLARVSFRLLAPDWALIESLSEMLVQSRPAAEALREITDQHFRPTLRHVLNAAWVARLAHPEVDRAESAEPGSPPLLSGRVHDLCVALLDSVGAAPTTPPPGPSRNPMLPQAT